MGVKFGAYVLLHGRAHNLGATACKGLIIVVPYNEQALREEEKKRKEEEEKKRIAAENATAVAAKCK